MPDGTGIGIYEANGTAGDEISSTYEGRHLTFPESSLAAPNALVQKGDPVVVHTAGGDIVGVAFNTAVLNTDLIAIDTEGIWMLSVKAIDDFGNIAVAVGDALYINDIDQDCEITRKQDPEQNTLFGYALGSITEGNTATIAVKVHWGPSEDRILMGIATNYTEATSGRPRVKINSDYSGVDGIHRAVHVTAQMTDDSGTNTASLYAARFQGILPAGSTLNTLGTIEGNQAAHSGVRGEVYAPGSATITGCRFINGVHATANVNSAVLGGHYSAYLAYCSNADEALMAHSMFYAWGYFRNGIDLSGWVAAPAADNHALVLTAAEGCTATANNMANNAMISMIRVEIGGVDGWVPVMAAFI